MRSNKPHSKSQDYEDLQAFAEKEKLLQDEAVLKAHGMTKVFQRNVFAMLGIGFGMVTFRAGMPNEANKKRGGKTGLNLTKSTPYGWLTGFLAADVVHGRLIRDEFGNLVPKGHHHKDAANLHSSPLDREYQHVVQVELDFANILADFGEDDSIYDYQERKGSKLFFKYKPGKGNPNFNGVFVLDLEKLTEASPVYSRPWDKPEWEKLKLKIEKFAEATKLSPGTIDLLKIAEMPLYHGPEDSLEPTKRFANKPETATQLLDALRKYWSGLYGRKNWHEADEQDLGIEDVYLFIRTKMKKEYEDEVEHEEFIKSLSKAETQRLMDLLGEEGYGINQMAEGHASKKQYILLDKDKDKYKESLAVIYAERQMREFYDRASVAVTGDWDIFDMAPNKTAVEPFGTKYHQVFNTFAGPDQRLKLMCLSKELFLKLVEIAKNKDQEERTKLDEFILFVDSQDRGIDDLHQEFPLQRGGCISPFEFLFTQLSNYSSRCEFEGNPLYDANEYCGMQEAFDCAKKLFNDKHGEKYKKEFENIALINTALLTIDEWWDDPLQSVPMIEALGLAGFKTSDVFADKETRRKELQEALKDKIAVREKRIAKIVSEAQQVRKAELEKANFEFDPVREAELQEHLRTHIQAYMQDPDAYGDKIKHPGYDFNMQDLLQHGAENRNPYEPDLDGPFVVCHVVDGHELTLQIKTEEQLIAYRLSDSIIEKNQFDVSWAADMRKGWGEIIRQQIEHVGKENIEKRALRSYRIYQQLQFFNLIITQRSLDIGEVELLCDMVELYDSHRQKLSAGLMEVLKKKIKKKSRVI